MNRDGTRVVGLLMAISIIYVVNSQPLLHQQLSSDHLHGGHVGSPVELSVLGLSRPVCASLPPDVRLTATQSKLCVLYPDHMFVVVQGAQLGLEECRWQFRADRWNCSTPAALLDTSDNFTSTWTTTPHHNSVLDDDEEQQTTASALNGSSVAAVIALAELLTPSITIATAEAAYRHAVLSAGVLHAVSRACRDGDLASCSCSTRSRPEGLDPDWVWGGCGDNTQYGYRFSVGFVDAREREKNYPRHSKQLARMLVNLHNNEAGRRAVYRYTKASCKCHGVSGSCSMRTCWNQLPSFREVGDRLRFRYERARQMAFNAQGTALTPVKAPTDSSTNRRRSSSGSGSSSARRSKQRPTREDMVFVDRSPDYCDGDDPGSGVVSGATGTRGRLCDRTSSGPTGCSSLCCGRGYDTVRTRVTERCNCKFQWCCYVVCQTCRRIDNVYSCK